jgi:hypothetical protein
MANPRLTLRIISLLLVQVTVMLETDELSNTVEHALHKGL